MASDRYVIANHEAQSAVYARPRANRRANSVPAIRALEIPNLQKLIDTLSQAAGAQLIVVTGLLAFAALLYLIQASQTSVYDYNIGNLQARYSQLSTERAGLITQAASLTTYGRIDSLAANQLHMTKSGVSNFMWVSASLPTVVTPRPLNADLQTAQRSSQPTAWLARAWIAFRNSL